MPTIGVVNASFSIGSSIGKENRLGNQYGPKNLDTKESKTLARSVTGERSKVAQRNSVEEALILEKAE